MSAMDEKIKSVAELSVDKIEAAIPVDLNKGNRYSIPRVGSRHEHEGNTGYVLKKVWLKKTQPIV